MSILDINRLIYNYENTKINVAPNGVAYLTFKLLEEAGVKHGFSTRIGGVSEGIYRSMNLSFHRGDLQERVRRNHELFAEAIGYNSADTVFSDQIHETTIARVYEADRGRGMKGEKGISGADGLVTDCPGVPLMTFYADCVPLFFYDPVKKVIGMAHSGWRGTVKEIGRVMVEYLGNEMGCDLRDILCVIGPSICEDCYEVNEDVAKEFESHFPQTMHRTILTNKGDGKYKLNLWEANRYILEEAGVAPEHIEMPNICTCHTPELLISHRETVGRRGNMAGVMVL